MSDKLRDKLESTIKAPVDSYLGRKAIGSKARLQNPVELLPSFCTAPEMVQKGKENTHKKKTRRKPRRSAKSSYTYHEPGDAEQSNATARRPQRESSLPPPPHSLSPSYGTPPPHPRLRVSSASTSIHETARSFHPIHHPSVKPLIRSSCFHPILH